MRVTKRMTGLLAAGVFAVGGTFAQAAVIDTFDVGGFEEIVSDVEGETVTNTETGLDESDVIGGGRQVSVTLTPGSTSEVGVSVNSNVPGTADLISDPGSQGTFLFEYGFDSDLNADLTDGGASDLFLVQFFIADAETNITISATDGDGTTASAVRPTVGAGDFIIPFADFDSELDFTDIASLDINIDGRPNGDYRINFVTTAIPTPAALPGGLAILGVMGLMRRRRHA